MPEAGVVLHAVPINEDGNVGGVERFAVELEEGTVAIRRIGQRRDVVWTLELADVEAAMRFLRAERRRVSEAEAWSVPDEEGEQS